MHARMDYNQIVASRLAAARKDAGIKQIDAAEYLKVSQSKLSKIEKASTKIEPNTIGRLTELYDISADWLFGMGTKKRKE